MITIKSPIQAIYDGVFSACFLVTDDVYAYQPKASVKMPFIFVGETFDNNAQYTKMSMRGEVVQTINIYANHKNRKEVLKLSEDVSELLRSLKLSEYDLVFTGMNNRVIYEEFGSETLIRAILEVEYKYY